MEFAIGFVVGILFVAIVSCVGLYLVTRDFNPNERD